MASTRDALGRVGDHLAESMGVREHDPRPTLSPVPRPRDVGRRPVRNVGRVDVNQVIPDPDQPRAEFDDDALDRLSQSIRDKGQLAPIRVRWADDLGKWVIVSGERRWRATRRAGLPDIECYFHDDAAGMTKSEILEQQLIENLLREDLQPMEEARAYQQLIELNGWTGKQLADALRVAPSKVTRSLALLKLPPDVQVQVAAGVVSPRAGYQISRVPDDETRRTLAGQAAQGALTHEDAARVARRRTGKGRGRGVRQTFLAGNGLRVVVSAARKGTYGEIEAALAEALEDVRTRIRNCVQLP